MGDIDWERVRKNLFEMKYTKEQIDEITELVEDYHGWCSE